MSGITAAQYLRRKAGIVVYTQIKEGHTYCVVKQGDKILNKALDDPFATLSWLTCSNLADTAYKTFKAHRKYPVPACSAFFNCFDIAVIKQFDRAWFENDVIPAIQGKTNVEKIANEYYNYDFDSTDPTEQYEIYDWIVRVYVQLRRMKWDVAEVKVPDDAVVQEIMAVLGNLKAASFVSFDPGHETMIPALKAVHPSAVKVHTAEGDVWVCDPKQHEQDPLGLSGTTFEDVDWRFNPIEHAILNPAPRSIHAAEEEAATKQEYRDIYQKVVHCLTTPHQSLSEEERAFMDHGGNPDIVNVDKGGIGKNKLYGLGSLCGEGPIGECIDRVVAHLRNRLPGFSEEDVRNLAAGRISKMSSEKFPKQMPDGVHIFMRAGAK